MLNHCPPNKRHMKTTFKSILASELLAVCSETTGRQRDKPKGKDARKFSEVEADKIYSSLPPWTGDARNQLMTAFSILLKAPELATAGRSKGVFDLFSVVVCGKNVNNHPWGKDIPFIIVHSRNQVGLSPDGRLDTYYRDNDKPRLATEDETVECIKDLTAAQWKIVMNDPLFSPIVESAMQREVVIDENEVVLTEADKQAADEAP